MYIADRDKCDWLSNRIELHIPVEYSREQGEVIVDRLIWRSWFESYWQLSGKMPSSWFEKLLATKWENAKRFGLEGAETLIPGMKAIFDKSADLGIESIVMGLPRRFRPNVLANVLQKPLRQMLSEFSGDAGPMNEDGLYIGTGDVRYHLGTSHDRSTRSGKTIHLSLLDNPSHLEAVNLVVVGKIKAKQYYSNDKDRTRNVGVLIHGDFSFTGQVVEWPLHFSGCFLINAP